MSYARLIRGFLAGGVLVFMIRPGLILVAIAIAVGAAGVVGAAGDLHRILIRNAERATFSDACEHYQARAGSARRVRPGEFVVFLADICAAAQVSLEGGTQEQQARAALLLSRIVLLRDTIDQMNDGRDARAAARLRAPNVNGAEMNGATVNRVTMVSRVTPSGEFLIAHRMGLMIAFDAWLDTGVDFSLAFYQ